MISSRPLPDRVRPRSLEEVIGHDTHLSADGELGRMLAAGKLHSLVLWGPPGCGKTTLARLLAGHLGARWIPLSAVLDGVQALRQVVESAEQPALDATAPVVFVDEIHRWNKAQQDALLPHVERGTVVLIGATTEQPSTSLRPALRSRLRLIGLRPPTSDDIAALLAQAWGREDGLGRAELASPEVYETIARAAGGDVRRALIDLERVGEATPAPCVPSPEDVPAILGRPDLRHDRDGDSHFDLTSAWIKSMRGSDPDAAIYWLARLIAGGEDPVFLCRRLVIFAAEDVGNADPRALAVAHAAAGAVQLVGMPEGRIPLAQATTWLACAPKSNASYLAIDAALADVQRTGALPVPEHLRSASGAAERQAGLGVGYRYPHDHPDRIVRQRYRPDNAPERTYYDPADHGEERVIRRRMAWWDERLKRRSS